MSKRAAFFGMFGAILWTAGLAWMSVARAPFYADDRVFSEQWVATNPNSSNAHNGVALVAAQSGDLATALIEYRRSLQLDPHSSTALNNSANLLVDIAHRRYAAGDSDGADAALREAAEYYRRLLAIDPSDASALCNYGDLLGETGDVNRAIDCYRKAIAARPGYAQAHYHLAIGLYVIDQPAESKSEFETALRLRPDWPEALHDYLVRLNDDRSPSFRDPLRAAQIESRLSTLRLPTPASGTSTR
jgi:tetratricopeptide (TPR) repeat protein